MLVWEKDNTIAKNHQKYAFWPCMNKCSYLTNQLEYGHIAKIFELLTWYHIGTQFLRIGVTTAQLSPLLNTVSFLIKRVFIPSFVMLYTENIGLRDFSGFLQIRSHIDTQSVVWSTNYYIGGLWHAPQENLKKQMHALRLNYGTFQGYS